MLRRLRIPHFAAVAAAMLFIGTAIAQTGQTTSATTGQTGVTSATTGNAAGRETKPDVSLQDKAKTPEPAPKGEGQMARTTNEIYLTLSCLAFGIIVMLIIRFSLPKDWNQVDITRVYGTPLLITGTIVLVASGINQDAVAPAYGLFGTIAGFVLSKNLNENRQGGDVNKAEASAKPTAGAGGGPGEDAQE